MHYDEEGKYIPKSKQFERALDEDALVTTTHGRIKNIQFGDQSNIDFYATSADEVLKGSGDREPLLPEFLRIFFGEQVSRMDILYGYGEGKNYTVLNDIRRAQSSSEKSDKRVAHNWGGYISEFATSFMLSKPVTVLYRTDDREVEASAETKMIQEVNRANQADRTNYDLGLDASIVGRGMEILHYSKDGDPQYRFTRIDPREAFIVRSANLERKPLLGVYCPVYNGQVHMVVWTETERYEYHPFDNNPGAELEPELRGVSPHNFDGIPLNEWRNSRDRTGDFETEIPLIDAYDSAQSDSVNYMNDFNDALLVISNVDIDKVMGNNLPIREMLDANMLILEGQRSGVVGEGSVAKPEADYIFKQYDTNGAEANKNRILQDLFNLTGIPDMHSLNKNRQSTESYQNKYVGVKQLKHRKEQYFSEALRNRYRLLQNAMSANNEGSYDFRNLSFRFHENAPTDVWSEIDAYIRSGGELSQETLRENASFTTHEEEEKRLEAEGSDLYTPEMRAQEEINPLFQSLPASLGNVVEVGDNNPLIEEPPDANIN